MSRAGALVQWLKLPAGIQVSKKQNATSSLICKDLMLWGASVTSRARISNTVSVGQCHLIHITKDYIPRSHHPQQVFLAQFSTCVHRWPKPPVIHVSRVRNKLENVYGSCQMSHDMMSSLRLILDEVLAFSIATLLGSEKMKCCRYFHI